MSRRRRAGSAGRNGGDAHPRKGDDSERAGDDEDSRQVGWLVGHYGVAVDVRLDDGTRTSLRVKRNSGHVVGDRVRVSGEFIERLPRETVLQRRRPRGGIQAVAANLDILGVVAAPVPVSPWGFIERAVVAARATGIEPFLVVNKTDLPGADALESELRSRFGESLSVYRTSAEDESGLDELRELFRTRGRGAFVGTSGVGKSSLLNALCPGIDLDVGPINESSGLGMHITTTATLHEIPGGGELVDTPGFREFGVVELSPADLSAHFPGFESVSGTCRFRNCLHRHEPGCAVTEAVEAGELATQCHQTYLQILGALEQEAAGSGRS